MMPHDGTPTARRWGHRWVGGSWGVYRLSGRSCQGKYLDPPLRYPGEGRYLDLAERRIGEIPAFAAMTMGTLSRHLLARAMEAAAADDDAARRHADRAAIGEERGERVDRSLIVRNAIGRDDDGGVADVEVHIARRRNLAADLDAAG